jgi:hypothetical protein
MGSGRVFADHDLTDRVERLALKTMMGHAGFLPGFLFAFDCRSGIANMQKEAGRKWDDFLFGNREYHFSGVKVCNPLYFPLSRDTPRKRETLDILGGEGGIRTHGGRKPSAVFKTAALNHSTTSPSSWITVILYSAS